MQISAVDATRHTMIGRGVLHESAGFAADLSRGGHAERGAGMQWEKL